MNLAVIGGGPVGLSTALMLVKQGHSVDLYEKGRWPKDKTCGQGIMPSGKKILSDLGVHFKEGVEGHSFSGIRYHHDDLLLKGLFKRKGIGVERRILSEKLYEKCKEVENLNLFPETTLFDVIQKDSGVVLFLRHDEKGYEKDYDYVFACDGINSLMRKLCSNRSVRRGPWRMGAREHFEVSPSCDQVEVYWQNGMEAYVTPVSSKKVEVAFLWYEDQLPKGGNLYKALWSQFPELSIRFPPHKSCEDFRGYGPFSTYAAKEKVDRIYFLGDAYCFLDGITGEGLSLGFKGARLVTEHFDRWSFFKAMRFKALYVHYGLMVRLALFFSRKMSLRRSTFKVLKRIPKGFSFLVRLNDFSL